MRIWTYKNADEKAHTFSGSKKTDEKQICVKLDGSLPENPVNDRREANAVTLKSTFSLPKKSAIIQKYLIMEPPEKWSQIFVC